MEKSLCLESSHNFANLAGYFNSETYVLPGNKITIGEIKQVLHNHFADQFRQRYEPSRGVIEQYGTGMDRMVEEKVYALQSIILFLFSVKKPSGLCVRTRSSDPKAKSDKFYTNLVDQHEALLKMETDTASELLKFYPLFQNEYSAVIEQFNLIIKNLSFLSSHNDRVTELVLDGIHTLKMNPEAYDIEHIRKLIKESVQVIKDAFPYIKQHQPTDSLQQYYSKELNYIVVMHGEEGPRRLDTSDKSKSERRKAEETELKKRGL